MKNISFNFYRCDDILNEFGEEKIRKRYQTLYDEMAKFIEVNELQAKAVINNDILSHVITDYFYDILRLKEFHMDIQKTNSQKVIAYTAYWLLYRKPIQIINNDAEEKQLVTVNERFVLKFILDYLSERTKDKHILLRDNKGLKNFADLLLYYLVFRKHDAQSLEMIITAFLAGQIYESTEVDITDELHPFDQFRV